MVTAPVVVLIYDRIFLVSREGGFGELLRRRWGLYVGLVASWQVLVLVRRCFAGCLTPLLPNRPAWGLGVANFTPLQYALTQPGVILHYLRLLLLAASAFAWTMTGPLPPAPGPLPDR